MGRGYKTEKGKANFMDPSNTPAVMMAETLERTVFEAEFDDCELALKLTAGEHNINAVIMGFKDPIRDHDIKVLEVEELMEVFFEKNKIYKRELKTVKNWETGINILPLSLLGVLYWTFVFSVKCIYMFHFLFN